MGGVDPDLVLALADGVDGLVSSREECLVKRDRRRFPLFIGAEIGTVRVSVTEILVEKLVHRIEIAAVQRFLKIGPVLDHLLLTFGQDRSEEHTSELQSLMRISYAVFCLKKKKQKH